MSLSRVDQSVRGAPPVRALPSFERDREALHVLDRLAFGPTLRDMRYIHAIGIDGYIAEQLDPDSIPEDPGLTARLAALDTLALRPAQLFAEYGPLPRGSDSAACEDRRLRAREILRQAQEARLARAIHGRRQLHEVMVNFWFNHFNVFAGKGLGRLWIGSYDEQAIRPHALGRFRDLLLATARHPAMLNYLDNARNSAARRKRGGGRVPQMNENYAREVLELHTLGNDEAYTEADVIELARILTGWRIARTDVDGTGFVFNRGCHDQGPKRLLDCDIRPGGEAEGLAAIELLAGHPATARHIASRLCQYFVADTPAPVLVARLAACFEASGGDIRTVLAMLFGSAEFRASTRCKYKTPYHFVVSGVRAAGASWVARPLLAAIAAQGQPLYHCPAPEGFLDLEDRWLSPGTTLRRVSFAVALARGQWGDPGERRPVDAAALGELLDPVLSRRSRAVIAAAPPARRASLILGSPDFAWR